MIEPVAPLVGSVAATALQPSGGVAPTRTDQPQAFGSVLSRALDNLNQLSHRSDQMAEAFAAGEDIEIHDVMLAMQETQLAFELATQVRNRLVDAYQEIMRMQV